MGVLEQGNTQNAWAAVRGSVWMLSVGRRDSQVLAELGSVHRVGSLRAPRWGEMWADVHLQRNTGSAGAAEGGRGEIEGKLADADL